MAQDEGFEVGAVRQRLGNGCGLSQGGNAEGLGHIAQLNTLLHPAFRQLGNDRAAQEVIPHFEDRLVQCICDGIRGRSVIQTEQGECF